MSSITHLVRAISACTLVCVAVSGCACSSCYRPQQTYDVDDTQIAQLTEGTGTPTQYGCEITCLDLRLQHDAGPLDSGPRDAAAFPVTQRAESCTLSGHQLTCVFPWICAS